MRKMHDHRAVVLFSGGQDSSIALVWALSKYREVYTLGFDYGQRHAVELEARRAMRAGLRAHCPQLSASLKGDKLVSIARFDDFAPSAMTSERAIEMGEDGLPTTFSPGRNLVFLTHAGAYAYGLSAGSVVAGMCEADFSGYPDCRAATIAAQERALRLGMNVDIRIETPLMRLSKAASWTLLEELGGRAVVDLVNERSHSCYRGDRSERHDWGYGCGRCPACALRARGWRDYEASRASPA